MSGLSQLLETARRALLTQQGALSVVSHNVANASTPGYSRQRAELAATTPTKETFGMLGTGVTILGIDRLRNGFIDQQIRASNQVASQADTQSQILSQIEASVNEPSTGGLSSAMSSFFNAWQDLSTHPEDSASRNAVLQQGVALTQTFHSLTTQMSQLKSSLIDDANTKVSSINSLAQEISDLDVQITSTQATGASPNDAMDQRDEKIQELSQLGNISVATDKNGSVMVSLGGTVIASRAGATLVKTSVVGNQIAIVTDPGNVQVNVTGGELGGVLNANNTIIPGYQSSLDQLAGTLITSVNTLHASGLVPTNFFSGADAESIGIDPAVDPTAGGSLDNIVASSDGTAGNNDIALGIAGLLNTSQAALGGQSLSQYYDSFVSRVGSDIDSANSTSTSQQLVLTQLQSQQDSVAGVSIDEEMTNMIQFQRSYDAAARLVSTTDQMFQTILAMVGTT